VGNSELLRRQKSSLSVDIHRLQCPATAENSNFMQMAVESFNAAAALGTRGNADSDHLAATTCMVFGFLSESWDFSYTSQCQCPTQKLAVSTESDSGSKSVRVSKLTAITMVSATQWSPAPGPGPSFLTGRNTVTVTQSSGVRLRPAGAAGPPAFGSHGSESRAGNLNRRPAERDPPAPCWPRRCCASLSLPRDRAAGRRADRDRLHGAGPP
jgi:hypothetical protein